MDFGSLYRRHAGDVFRFALYLSGNYAQAEDIAAETFARAWVGRDRIRAGTVKAYLLTIARNLYRDQVKSARARGSSVDAAAERVHPGADPEMAATHSQQLTLVLTALARLPEQDREVLSLAAIEELPYEQIAATLGVSVGAVKVRIHRARLKLNRLLDGKEHP